ncbi:MAG: STAS domain-containing protein [Actinomycetota bacterium]
MAPMRSDEIWDYRWGQVQILVVRGDLDAYLAVDLSAYLERALAGSPAEVLVDLEEVRFMDAAALGVLESALQRARAHGGDLRLVAPSAPVDRLLRLTHMEGHFPVESDLIAAFERSAGIADPQSESGCDGAA